MEKKIIIFSGEPKSINPELIYKSWKKSSSSIKNKIYVITNYELFKKQLLKFENTENPTHVIACVGGGSNAAGLFYPFLNNKIQTSESSIIYNHQLF